MSVPDSSSPAPAPPATPDVPAGAESVSLAGAAAIVRGVRRALAQRGFATLTEFRLASGRRADVLAIDDTGTILIVEVKSGVADFRSDRKWPEYRDWCDAFYFAVNEAFPTDLVPDDCGLFVADSFGAALRRDAPAVKLSPARRKALVLRAALAAAGRLHRLEDPAFAPDQLGG